MNLQPIPGRTAGREAPQITVIIAALAVTTFWVFWPVGGHDFLNYDDDTYITANRQVSRGLSTANIRWAFTGFGYAANWHPLTWLSHQLDVSLFGLNPGGHHFVNLLLHIAAALLLFFALRLATGAVWKCALVAALFAVHPMHVESVAWVAERKDVLSGFFWMLTLLAYLRYVRKPGTIPYLFVTVCFLLGLLAKPMLVSLPPLLLLLDHWPLGRWGRPIPGAWHAARRLLYEKIPLLLLAGASGAATYLAQESGGGLIMTGHYSLGVRLANAVVSLARYLGRLLLPIDLAVLYPFRQDLPAAGIAVAALFVLGMTVGGLLHARRRPWFLTGWLWYLVAVLPVIGILQVGYQSMADRYTYLPAIGIFILVAWEIGDLGRRLPHRRALLIGTTLVVPIVFAGAARHQVNFWQDSETLFRRAVSVTTRNWLAENNLGVALLRRGKPDEAIEHFTKALEIRPEYARARVSLGDALLTKGLATEAIAQYDEALRFDPAFSLAWYGRGLALLTARRFEAAAADFRKTLTLHPESADVHGNLGAALLDLGRSEEAMGYLQEALRLNPAAILPRLNIGLLHYKRGQAEEAAVCFREVIRLDPGRPEAHFMLGRLDERDGKAQEAVTRYREALRLRPAYPEARSRLDRLTGKPVR